MGNHHAGRAMVQTAIALVDQREKTGQTALEILDIACKPYEGCDAEFDGDAETGVPVRQAHNRGVRLATGCAPRASTWTPKRATIGGSTTSIKSSGTATGSADHGPALLPALRRDSGRWCCDETGRFRPDVWMTLKALVLALGEGDPEGGFSRLGFRGLARRSGVLAASLPSSGDEEVGRTPGRSWSFRPVVCSPGKIRHPTVWNCWPRGKCPTAGSTRWPSRRPRAIRRVGWSSIIVGRSSPLRSGRMSAIPMLDRRRQDAPRLGDPDGSPGPI